MPEKPKPEAKSTAERRPSGARPPRYRIPEEQYAAARIIYEATPGMTFVKLADETGISWRSLEERSRKEGWTRRELLPPAMGEAAQQVADSYSGKLADYGPDITADDKQSVLKETTAELAIDIRGQLLERHRREWGAVRSLVYDTLRKKEYGDNAKLAKITAETLQIIQSNERKAWGIDKVEPPGNTVVVIERGT